ncbi:MAG: hypothetical protein WA628_24475, partial [Terriglobales bacterium]
MAEGVAQPLLEVESLEEELKQKQTGKGGQLLVFEQQVGSGVGFTPNLFSAKLHGERSPWVGDGVLDNTILPILGPLFHKSSRFLELTEGAVQRQSHNAVQTPADRPLSAFGRDSFCNWRVNLEYIAGSEIMIREGYTKSSARHEG